jgi:hypothetical protein
MVVNIAASDDKKNTPLRNISTGSLVLVLFEIFVYA